MAFSFLLANNVASQFINELLTSYTICPLWALTQLFVVLCSMFNIQKPNSDVLSLIQGLISPMLFY